ncbi:ABC transporter ATP-binding protein [Agrococcus sp. SGAir0287]|uniref:ABC transporter ATP-binding protein n=1 Tax=Agrococcus sp. SGAir0287 TaxID=2070347 RepID=UPI0010CD2C68|nr:ABC transporter ATP-binding protein [Agrococcus sp. SGAir0287]QCR18602.1 ABC transporter [Agrococcus sp. SGAir0287]
MSERRGFLRRPKDDGPKASVRELLPYLFPKRGLLAGALVLSVLGAATSLAQPLLVQQIITAVQESQPLRWLPWVLVVLVLVDAALGGFQHFLLQILGEHVVLRTRTQLVARLLHLPIAEFDQRRTGDLVSRVGSDTTLLRAVLTQGLVESVGGLLTFVGAIVAMLVIDPALFGLTLLVVVAAFAAVLVVMPMLTRATRAAQEQVGHLTSALERAISAVRTVRASNATDREIAVVGERSAAAFDAGVRVARISALVVPIAGVAVQVAFLVVIGVGGLRVATGDLSIAALVGFLMFLSYMIFPLGQMIGAVTAVSTALGALGRIQEIVRLAPEDAGDLVVDATPTADAVAFEGVSFRYPESVVRSRLAVEGSLADDADAPIESPIVLHDVSFTVAPGTRTAIVGPSGAGKSTLFALVERFYDPTAGRIVVGGRDVRSVDRRALRAGIGYVEQDAPVLAGTIRDNLLLASPDATDERLLDVLGRVNLRDVVDRSPEGLDAVVGERGVRLSGGERQRLAIARALLAAPGLLLLDESTSSLDGRNEAQLQAAIDEVAAGRTLLVIAHRLSTVVDADQIVVLDAGRVVATGTHDELLATSPLYRELAEHQLLVPAEQG